VRSDRRAFGERLRRQRERQDVTLASIAQTTKVAASLFAGLERGDCSRWPGGVYSRSFVRAYAAAVGLDPEEIAAEFAEYYETVPTTPPVSPPGERSRPAASPPLRLIIEVDPIERRWRIAKRAGIAVAEIAIVVLAGSIAAFGTGTSFWLDVSIASLTFQILGRLMGAGSALDKLMTQARPSPVTEAASEAIGKEGVGETVETIA
jgi:transcriptional regulator with XRE-family HTH domain